MTHSFLTFLFALSAVLIYSAASQRLREFGLLLLVTIGISLLLDSVSNSFQLEIIRFYYVSYFLTVYSSPSPYLTLVLAVPFLVSIVFLLLFRKRPWHQRLKERFEGLVRWIKKDMKRALSISLISATLLFLVALYWWRRELHWFSFTLSYDTVTYWNFVFPWYFWILSGYGIALIAAIAASPLLVYDSRSKALRMTVAMITSALLLALIPFFTPLAPNLWSNRSLGLVVFGLVVLSSISLSLVTRREADYSNRSSRPSSRAIVARKSVSIAFILIVSISFLSFSLQTERYVEGADFSLERELKDSIEWIHSNLPRNAKVLTYSLVSATFIERTSMISTVSYEQVGRETFSWPLHLVFRSTLPEVVLFTLWTMNITHIYVTDSDFNRLEGSGLLELLSVFPLEYGNLRARIYRVPTYKLVEDSPLTLIRGDLTGSHMFYFAALLANKVSFAVKSYAELDSIRPDGFYMVSGEIPSPVLIRRIVEGIESGATVVLSYEALRQLSIANLPMDFEDTLLYDGDGVQGWQIGNGIDLELTGDGKGIVVSGVTDSNGIVGAVYQAEDVWNLSGQELLSIGVKSTNNANSRVHLDVWV
ncbi:MAG: hypothetical protein ACE5IO_09965, partial [Thermoplasmata archaeon]